MQRSHNFAFFGEQTSLLFLYLLFQRMFVYVPLKMQSSFVSWNLTQNSAFSKTCLLSLVRLFFETKKLADLGCLSKTLYALNLYFFINLNKLTSWYILTSLRYNLHKKNFVGPLPGLHWAGKLRGDEGPGPRPQTLSSTGQTYYTYKILKQRLPTKLKYQIYIFWIC